ncbi:MAG: right-handed parallel beta-helix repeat-containing protein, partial [Planctomycetota bacterium]|nr:right-handed parallel beta-helix repeat-containing protein [Planctomycetota bacterium]
MLFLTNRTIAVALLFSFIASTGIASDSSLRTVSPPRVKPDPNALTLFVSPAGNDSWSGKLAAPNPSGTDGPLATIEKARDRIRQIKAAQGGLKKPLTVLIRSGVYPQTKAIVFTPDDSGTKACPITYQVYPGEHAVISGGRPITGWRPDDGAQSKTRCNGKLWRADVSRAIDGERRRFNQLFVNGRRRTRARTPNKGDFFRTDGPIDKNNTRAFYFKEGDMKQWSNLRDVIAVVYHSWETSIHHIRSIDPETCLATFLETAPWPMGRWEKQQRYYVENVFEGLDRPGEWYLNRKTATLYYYPLPGEKMDRIQAVAPLVTSTLVSFKGDPANGKFVEHLNFRGLAFQHTDANLRRLRNPGQGEIYQPAAIMAVGLRNSVLESCEVAHTAAHAIWMAAGCADNRIERCHLHDLGGGGVYIGGGWGVQDTTPVERITVDNSFIHDGSHIFHGAHGVWIGRSSYNKITHNEISNFDYSGISCGWSWGFQPSSAHHNNLDHNHIHHLGNGDGLSDMGGIYTLGISPGTTERNNHIHHIYSYAHVSHGSGVYPDEGSSQILIENNVVHHVRTCPLFQHYGKDNTVRNNILAFGGRGQLQRCREDKPCHYAAEGNIVYADIRQMLGGVWKSGDWKLGRNVYWSTAGPPVFNG